jgi:hypothetical protein
MEEPPPDCDPLLDGIELPPERLELPPELPELPELPPEDEEGAPEGLGELVEEDCCSGQPPMRKSVTAPSVARRPSAVGSELRIWMSIVTPVTPPRTAEHGRRSDFATRPLNAR